MRVLVTLFCLVSSVAYALANNIDVSNVVVTGRDLSAGANNVANFTMVKFDITWENSWRTNYTSNWDAAWIFVKFRRGMTDPTLSGVSSSGTTVTVSSTTGLRVGMPVRVSSGTGVFAAGSVISSITNGTQFVVSATPTATLSNATVVCTRIWEHARLNNTGHALGSIGTSGTLTSALQTPGSAFDRSTNPVVGVLLHRSAVGAGTFTSTGVQLRWNYGANGITDDDSVDVRVFGIEMVYVPQGSFFVGSGGTESGSFTNGSWTTGATTPLQITSENAISIAQTSGNLWGTSGSGNNDIGGSGTLAAAFPKGFAAFYCMKHEITQGQYRDFLNTLSYAQQATRTQTAPTSTAGTGALSSTNANRNGIDIETPGNATTLVPATYACNLNNNAPYNSTDDGEWIACNFISWMDGSAFADWAGLRPMTELEFEKACRGNQTAVAGEYAWGNASTTAVSSNHTAGWPSNATAWSITNVGANNEVSTTANANAVIFPGSPAATNPSPPPGGTILGPLRTGTFAGSATTRAQAGATYYGIMEMSGNLWERPVSVATGRSFTGIHGDGSLSSSGNANATAWPGLSSGEVTTASGAGFRGAGWQNDVIDMRVSDRRQASLNNTGSALHYGFRAVRTAP